MPVSRKGYTRNGIEDLILDAVEETVMAYQMFQQGDSVLVCVSGGPDSVALLHILVALGKKFSLGLGVAHFNHCLREADSDRDAEFVVSLSKQLGLLCYTDKMDVQAYRKDKKLSLETAARRVRYSFFYRIADENSFSKIATGHHQEDNAELILMDILRGCGPRGLSGIPPIRDGRIIRPLIGLSRSEIDDFLVEKGLSARSDATNTDIRYLRNRIRHRLIPVLKSSYNPRIIETLNRLARIVRSEEEWIEGLVDSVFNQVVVGKGGDHRIALSVPILNEQHVAMKRRIIRKAITGVKGDLKRISLTHVEMVMDLLRTGATVRSLDLPDRIRVSFKQGGIIFSRETAPLRDIKGIRREYRDRKRPAFEYHLPIPGTLFVPELNGYLAFSVLSRLALPDRFPHGQRTVFFDMDNLNFPLKVRDVRSGDRFVPLGMIGYQKVNTFFINHKIPRPDRVKYPVVVDRNGRVIWVVGQRIDESFRVLSATRTVLKGELFLA